jgi:hypothetical protein
MYNYIELHLVLTVKNQETKEYKRDHNPHSGRYYNNRIIIKKKILCENIF